jgi:hypothetical protein
MTISEILGEVFKWFRRIFIITKGLVILGLSITFIYRYTKYKKTFNLFENWILLGVIVLDMALIVFEVWHSTNVIFAVFVLNALMKMIIADNLHKKCLSALSIDGYSTHLKLWLLLRAFILIGLIIWSFVPEVGLRCEPEIYPL